ncbi:MAG: hypothetical protein AAFW87_00575 [Pseudomonadota bacterium]
MQQQRKRRWINYTGLNLLRLVIGSYFLASAFGVIEGVSASVLFQSFVDLSTAQSLGTLLLVSITAGFMMGLYLRITSLMLALVVLTSSLTQNFFIPNVVNIDAFWRDLVLFCAVLLSYSCLKPTEVRRAALVWRRRTPRIVDANQVVVPRRITAMSRQSDRPQPLPTCQPAPDARLQTGESATSETAQKDQPSGDVQNIFAAL